jgi:predicted lipoprotein
MQLMVKMNNRLTKFLILLTIFAFIILISIRIQLLDKVKNDSQANAFNPKDYAQEFWTESLPKVLDDVVDFSQLLDLLENDKQTALEKYGKTVGIGAQHYFLVKGEGRIEEVLDDHVLALLTADSKTQISVLTDNLFSNAIRDASGLVNVSDFPNTMEFNTISAEINKLAKGNAIEPVRAQFLKDAVFTFIGAFELVGSGSGDVKIVPIHIEI